MFLALAEAFARFLNPVETLIDAHGLFEIYLLVELLKHELDFGEGRKDDSFNLILDRSLSILTIWLYYLLVKLILLLLEAEMHQIKHNFVELKIEFHCLQSLKLHLEFVALYLTNLLLYEQEQ